MAIKQGAEDCDSQYASNAEEIRRLNSLHAKIHKRRKKSNPSKVIMASGGSRLEFEPDGSTWDELFSCTIYKRNIKQARALLQAQKTPSPKVLT